MTELVAQVFGIYMLVAGFGLLLRPGWAMEILDSVEGNAALIYVLGAFMLIAGSALVLTHNIWRGWPEIPVTLIGWAAAIEGAIMLIYPPLLMGFSRKLAPNNLFIRAFALGTMVFGSALLWL